MLAKHVSDDYDNPKVFENSGHMRYISFSHKGRASFGTIVKGGLVDLGAQTGLPDLASFIAARFDELGSDQRSEPDLDPAEIRYLPVIPAPSKVICIAINYFEPDQPDRAVPAYPVLFTRFATSQTGHGQPVIKPSVSAEFDYEGELAVIIGKPGHRIREESALDHVAGYSCFNDGSVRDWQKHSSQFTPGKNFARSAGFGPWMVSRAVLPTPSNLDLVTRVNGETRQRTNTDRMIFSIPWLIAYISRFAPLQPGDVIVTGTPTGFGSSRKPPLFLQAGDVVEVEISGIGTLRNTVADEATFDEN